MSIGWVVTPSLHPLLVHANFGNEQASGTANHNEDIIAKPTLETTVPARAAKTSFKKQEGSKPLRARS